jgi:predicted transcriptional regulator
MKIVRQDGKKQYSLDTQELDISKNISLNKTTLKILETIKHEPKYPKQIAKEIKIHEQNVYYYIRKLEQAKIIKVKKKEKIYGIDANYYGLTSDSFFFKIKNFREGIKLKTKEPDFLFPFIEQGKFNSLIVIGSPDPHGKSMARSRDGHLFIDLAIFLGTFLDESPNKSIKLDTEINRHDLENNNLIVIGGPVVNKVSIDLNKFLPIQINPDKRLIKSKLSKKQYLKENEGLICKIKNPYNKQKQILIIAGNRFSGTQSGVIAIKNNLEDLENGNKNNQKIKCRIVEGIDEDNDGLVDGVKFLE